MPRTKKDAADPEAVAMDQNDVIETATDEIAEAIEPAEEISQEDEQVVAALISQTEGAIPYKGTIEEAAVEGEPEMEIPGEPASEIEDLEIAEKAAEAEIEKAAEAEDRRREQLLGEAPGITDNIVDFSSRRVSPLAHRERTSTYGAEHIRPIDPGTRPQFETALEEIERWARELSHAASTYGGTRKKSVRGVVDSVTNYNIGNQKIPCAEVMHGIYKVVIPIFQLTKLGIENRQPAELTPRYLNLLANERIGSEIDFYVQSFDEASGIAIGNRVEALEDTRRSYFRGRDAVKAGDCIEGRITYTSATRVGIEAAGCDAALAAGDCIWSRTNSLNDEFEVGNRVPVRIMSIDPDGNVAFSIREATPDPRAVYIKSIREGSKRVGRVVQITNTGLFVRLENMRFDCFCRPPIEFATPEIGSSVLVTIINVDEANLRVRGYVTRIL